MGWPEMMSVLQKTENSAYGQPCVFRPQSGGNTNFVGIFDERSYVIDPATGQKILTTKPQLTFKVSDLPALPKKNDVIETSSRSFKIRDFEPDGQGGATVKLYE